MIDALDLVQYARRQQRELDQRIERLEQRDSEPETREQINFLYGMDAAFQQMVSYFNIHDTRLHDEMVRQQAQGGTPDA